MAALSTIALVGGLALSAAGVGAQTYGAIRASEAQKQEIKAQQNAEASREQAQNLDAQRKRREAIRQGTIARGQALATGTNEGAGYGSGVQGALAGITEQTAYNVAGINENQQIGSQIFGYNRQAFAAKRQEADAGTIGAIGGGLSSLGNAFMRNTGNINKVGNYFGYNAA
jgi:hypothetical protein